MRKIPVEVPEYERHNDEIKLLLGLGQDWDEGYCQRSDEGYCQG